MPSRTRSRTDIAPGGSYFRASTGVSKYPNAFVHYDTIEDNVAPGNGHNLTIEKYYRQGGEITYWNGLPAGGQWNAYVPDALNKAINLSIYGHYSVPNSPTDSSAATELVAKTNPSRSVVDLPIFVAELRDLPRLMQNEGKDLLRRAGSANLNYHFGWAPLIRDLGQLFSFQGECAKRAQELRMLFKSGLRRKRRIFEGTMAGQQSNVTIQSFGDLWHADFSWETQERVWGFVKWFPTSLPPATDAEMLSLARRAVLGLTVDLSTAWELIPFSWLADWCTTTGNYLMSQRNIVGASHGPCQIMRTKTTVGSAPARSYPFGIRNSIRVGHLTKKRSTSSPSVSAYLPYLSVKQLSILGSIGLLSGRTPVARR